MYKGKHLDKAQYSFWHHQHLDKLLAGDNAKEGDRGGKEGSLKQQSSDCHLGEMNLVKEQEATSYDKCAL